MSLYSTATIGRDFKVFQGRTLSRGGGALFHSVLEMAGYLFMMGIKCGILAFFSIASMLAGIHVYGNILETDYFSIEEVVVTGLDKLSEDEILNISGVEFDENIFQTDLESITKKIAANPWVADVVVRRDFPGSLVIEITERKPFAKILVGGKLLLIDAKGNVLDSLKTSDYKGLPVIGGTSMEKPDADGLIYPQIFWTGLNLLKFAGDTGLFEDPIAGIRIDNVNEMTLITRHRKTEIKMDKQNIADGLSRLGAIFDYAKMEGKTIKTIDVCFTDRAVVKFAEDKLEKGQ